MSAIHPHPNQIDFGWGISHGQLKVTPPTTNSLDQNRQDIVIGNLEIKNGEVRSNYKQLYPKVSVTNNTDEEKDEEKKVFAKYSGIDSDGFAIDVIMLYGIIEPHSTRYISDAKSIELSKLKKIVKWQYEKQ